MSVEKQRLESNKGTIQVNPFLVAKAETSPKKPRINVFRRRRNTASKNAKGSPAKANRDEFLILSPCAAGPMIGRSEELTLEEGIRIKTATYHVALLSDAIKAKRRDIHDTTDEYQKANDCVVLSLFQEQKMSLESLVREIALMPPKRRRDEDDDYDDDESSEEAQYMKFNTDPNQVASNPLLNRSDGVVHEESIDIGIKAANYHLALLTAAIQAKEEERKKSMKLNNQYLFLTLERMHEELKATKNAIRGLVAWQGEDRDDFRHAARGRAIKRVGSEATALVNRSAMDYAAYTARKVNPLEPCVALDDTPSFKFDTDSTYSLVDDEMFYTSTETGLSASFDQASGIGYFCGA